MFVFYYLPVVLALQVSSLNPKQEAGIEEATLLQEHPINITRRGERHSAADATQLWRPWAAGPAPAPGVGSSARGSVQCLARGGGTVPTAAGLQPLLGALGSQWCSQQGSQSEGHHGTWSHSLTEPAAGVVGTGRGNNSKHPMCMTRFIYKHVRGTFTDFQKYLSVVGVILKEHRAKRQ